MKVESKSNRYGFEKKYEIVKEVISGGRDDDFASALCI